LLELGKSPLFSTQVRDTRPVPGLHRRSRAVKPGEAQTCRPVPALAAQKDSVDEGGFIAPIQTWGHDRHLFTAGSWGGTFRDDFTPLPGEIVAQEHWCSSGFANTDLDLQLKRHGIHKLIVIGLRANTCIDSTVRFAVELGYDVTLVKDATASYQSL
jgi:nicotinamidase-related amidase